jgi:N6-adenosine-specific RNA methylase IME4
MKFDVILSDPPWNYKVWSKKGAGRTASSHYPIMTTEDLVQLPVEKLAEDDCVLLMWATWPNLLDSIELIKAWGFCVAAGTRILTNDLRWIPAEQAAIGQPLLCFDDNLVNGRRYYRWGKVISTGLERVPCYRVILKDGRELVASAGHKWLANGGVQYNWATASEMMSTYNGRRVNPWRLPELAPIVSPLNTYTSGFLSAAFDSEGCLRKNKRNLVFSQNPNMLMAQVQRMLNEQNYSFTEYSYPQYHSASMLCLDGWFSSLRFLMEQRPPRLINNWLSPEPGMSLYNMPTQEVVCIEDAGIKEVVTLQTDVGTYIAEGFGAHNTYKTAAFVWTKTNRKSPGWHMGMGHWTRANTEFCLLGTIGHPKRISKGTRQLVVAPVTEHSHKPENPIYDAIQALLEPRRAIELFATKPREGYVSLGFDIDGRDIRESIIEVIKGEEDAKV